jgi:hypothetical protein
MILLLTCGAGGRAKNARPASAVVDRRERDAAHLAAAFSDVENEGFLRAPLAQRIRASDYGSEGRGFKSLRARQPQILSVTSINPTPSGFRIEFDLVRKKSLMYDLVQASVLRIKQSGGIVFNTLFFALTLFGSGGTIDWPRAWISLVVVFLGSVDDPSRVQCGQVYYPGCPAFWRNLEDGYCA